MRKVTPGIKMSKTRLFEYRQYKTYELRDSDRHHKKRCESNKLELESKV